MPTHAVIPATEPAVQRVRVEISPRSVFLVLGVIVGVWLLGQLVAVLKVVAIALVMVGTFDPLVTWLERRGLGRGRALVLVFVAAALVLVGIVLLMVPPLVSQLLDLIVGAPQRRTELIAALQDRPWAKPLIGALEDLPLDNLAAHAGMRVIGYSTMLFVYIGYGLSTLFLAIYLLADPARSKGLVYAVVPRRHHVKVARILHELMRIVGGYMRGQLITSASIAVFVFALLTILGADNALPIALFAGLTDVIPFVGGYIASTPVIVSVIPMGLTTTIVVAVIMLIYQEFESRILVPRVYGRVLRLPPAIVLIALLIGGTLGGFLGVMIALPIAAGLQMLVRELRVDLPGSVPASDELLARDIRASEIYSHLSQGSAPIEASVIAEEVATMVKESEEDGRTTMPGRVPP